MRKWIIAAIVAGALFAVGAFAASFALNAQDVSSGADPVAACSTGTATVQWVINDGDAVQVSPPTATSNFLITGANVNAPGCGSAQFRLAIQAGSEVLCHGTLSSGAASITDLSACASPAPAGGLNVNDVTGAALLIGDQTIALQTTP